MANETWTDTLTFYPSITTVKENIRNITNTFSFPLKITVTYASDSGSLIVDLNNNAVGLLFAGNGQFTMANPIILVLDALNVRLPLSTDPETNEPTLLDPAQCGWLHVNIFPRGLQADIFLNGIWVGKDGYFSKHLVGTYTLTFGDVNGYQTPSSLRVTIPKQDYCYRYVQYSEVIGVSFILIILTPLFIIGAAAAVYFLAKKKR
jgi:hypothetical protein